MSKFSESKSRKFQEVTPLSREEALIAFGSNEAIAICDALVRITYHDPDWRWVQDQCAKLARSPFLDVRQLAVTCLGHVARIHGELDIDQASSIFKQLLNDPEVAGTVEDAISDIQIFMKVDFSLT